MARVKRATFRDARTLASARAARRRAGQAQPDQTSKTEPRPTAADAYRAARAEIELQLNALAGALQRHNAAQRANPTNWHFVQDLNYIRDNLKCFVDFLRVEEDLK